MKKLFLIFSLAYKLSLIAQITDNYSNAALWNELDDPMARMDFTTVPGRLSWSLNYSNATLNQSNLRCVRNLNNEIVNSQNFRVSLKYRVTTALATGTTILALTQNNTQSFITRTGTTTFDCSTPNSSITVIIRPNNFVIQIKSNIVNACNTAYEISINSENEVNANDRLLELTKIGDRYRFRVYDPNTNVDFINQIFCSTVTPTGLNFVQHGNHSTAGEAFTGIVEVDELNVVGTNITDPTISAFPMVTINGPRGICEKDKRPITLTAVSPGAAFVWNNPPTNGENLIVSNPGTYTVKATVNNCINTSTVIVADSCRSASISSNYFKNNEIWAYPNPAKDYTELNYTNATLFKASRVVLTSISGQKIEEYNAESSLGRHSLRISTADLPSGIYFYSLERDGYIVATKKVQILR